MGTRTKDSTSTQVRWIRDAKTGQQQLWFISSGQGFQVIQFTSGAYPLTSTPVAGPVRQPVPQQPPPAARPPAGSPLAATGGSLRPAWAGLGAFLLAGYLLTVRRQRRRVTSET